MKKAVPSKTSQRASSKLARRAYERYGLAVIPSPAHRIQEQGFAREAEYRSALDRLAYSQGSLVERLEALWRSASSESGSAIDLAHSGLVAIVLDKEKDDPDPECFTHDHGGAWIIETNRFRYFLFSHANCCAEMPSEIGARHEFSGITLLSEGAVPLPRKNTSVSWLAKPSKKYPPEVLPPWVLTTYMIAELAEEQTRDFLGWVLHRLWSSAPEIW